MPTGISDQRNGQAGGMEDLGAKLRSLREAQHHRYEDVTEAIHVRPFVLQAIEEGRVLEVTSLVYARGFVKNYCEYLYADDLWSKYKDLFGAPESGVSVRAYGIPASGGINHPTPIFRRTSMLWVYLILVLAVAGAAYLLWWQQKESGTGGFPAFFLQNNMPSQTGAPESRSALSDDAASLDAAQSPDLPTVLPPTSPNGVVSAEPAVSADAAVSSVDLSWMDGNAPPASAARSGEPVGRRVQDGAENRLFIEITGVRCRLEVLQRGVILTTRALRRGDVRSYDVTADTEARFSDGTAARVVWRGTAYESIGSEKAPVRFRFAPSGAMTLLRGRSQYGQ